MSRKLVYGNEFKINECVFFIYFLYLTESTKYTSTIYQIYVVIRIINYYKNLVLVLQPPQCSINL